MHANWRQRCGFPARSRVDDISSTLGRPTCHGTCVRWVMNSPKRSGLKVRPWQPRKSASSAPSWKTWLLHPELGSDGLEGIRWALRRANVVVCSHPYCPGRPSALRDDPESIAGASRTHEVFGCALSTGRKNQNPAAGFLIGMASHHPAPQTKNEFRSGPKKASSPFCVPLARREQAHESSLSEPFRSS